MALLSSPDFLNNFQAAVAVARPYVSANGEPRGFVFIYVNNAFARLCGKPRQSLMGADFATAFPNAEREWVTLCAMAAYSARKIHCVKYSASLSKMLSVSAYSVRPGLCVCLARDITEQRQITAQRSAAATALKRAAEIDALTGLYNSGAGRSKAQDILDNAQTQSTLFVFDMDNFKQINDTGGHAQGDAALCAFADVLRRSFRAGDIVWRHGGDEFAALMPNCGGKRVIKQKCAQVQTALSQTRMPLSCSIGAVYGQGSFAAMFEAADAALYKTKAAGKCGWTVNFFDGH